MTSLARSVQALGLHRSRPVRAILRRMPRLEAWLFERWKRQQVLVPTEQLEAQFLKAVQHLAEDGGPVGDYLEFGVFKGDSILCMQRALDQAGVTDVRLFGFDSFEGMPDSTDPEDEAMRSSGFLSYKPGGLRSPYDFTVKAMTAQGADWNRISLVQGYFDQTLTPEFLATSGISRAGVIMIDCVMYSSTMTALEFCAPLIVDRSMVLIDDWETGDPATPGEHRAFEAFLESHPELSAEEFDTYLHVEDDPPSVSKVFVVRRLSP